jgi:ATP-dependent DNA ligase
VPEYIVQKAVNLDKVVKKRRLVLEQPGYLDQNYLGQAKYDGCHVIFVLTVAGEADLVLSRTGERVRSMEHMLPAMHRLFADQVMEHGGVAVLGEAWTEGESFATLSGQFRQHAPAPQLGVKVFDVLTSNEWEAGESTVPYIQRVQRVLRPQYRADVDWVSAAEFHFTPKTTGRGNTWQDWCNHLVDQGGYDGCILRDPEGGWKRGSGTTGEIIKLKRVLSFDLRVTGMEEGKGKHAGRLGAIVVDFRGKELRVGTGFSDYEREKWWRLQDADGTTVVGCIAEIEAMDYSEDGLLREPRFKGIRFDKLETD